jgi:hypothetical protein
MGPPTNPVRFTYWIQRKRGFKSRPEDRAAATVAAIDFRLKGFAGARNQHYLQLWRPAA